MKEKYTSINLYITLKSEIPLSFLQGIPGMLYHTEDVFVHRNQL